VVRVASNVMKGGDKAMPPLFFSTRLKDRVGGPLILYTYPTFLFFSFSHLLTDIDGDIYIYIYVLFHQCNIVARDLLPTSLVILRCKSVYIAE
jgi:hypothetical protein